MSVVILLSSFVEIWSHPDAPSILPLPLALQQRPATELSMSLSFSALCVICCIDFRQFNCQVYANAMQEDRLRHGYQMCTIYSLPAAGVWLVMATGTQ